MIRLSLCVGRRALQEGGCRQELWICPQKSSTLHFSAVGGKPWLNDAQRKLPSAALLCAPAIPLLFQAHSCCSQGLCLSCPILQVWSRVDQPPQSPSASLHLTLQPATTRGVLCLKCLFQAIKQV